MSLSKQHVVFVGNPGVGKSTLLNSLVGSAVFKSGLSTGSGLTQSFQWHEDKLGVRYVHVCVSIVYLIIFNNKRATLQLTRSEPSAHALED